MDGSGEEALRPVKTIAHALRMLVPLLGLWQGTALAVEQHSDNFDGPDPSWKVNFNSSQLKLGAHRRHTRIKVDGRSSEHFVLESLQPGAVAQFESPLPPARVIDDLELTLWMRSNRPGAILWLRAVLPHQTDPGTGRPAEIYFEGGRYQGPAGKWEQLSCVTLQKQKLALLGLLRSRIQQPQIDTRDMYVDRAVVTAQFDRGTVELFVDELRFGPIVGPSEDAVVQTAGESLQRASAVEFRLNQLFVEGRPFFPRIIPYHGENLDTLQQTGNVVYVPDYSDVRLLTELQQRKMWAAATPPRPLTPKGDVLQSHDAGFVPFSPETARILFWNLGTRIPGSAHEYLASWSNQIRNADRDFRRPIIVDVVGNERMISREIPMLSMSRHALNTSFSLRQYRDWLIERRPLPGSFPWTWIQTEPSQSNADWREQSRTTSVVVEPEQIFLQVYAALAAGCRGIGYWKRTPLDSEAAGADERLLAVSLLDLQLGLLEPWLATSIGGVWQIPFEPVGQDESTGNALLGRGDRSVRSKKSADQTRFEAAVIRSDNMLLLLPICYDDGSQFVPSAMVADEMEIVVPFHETASAWEVSTTGIRSLPRERGPGGIRIKLDRFDLGTVILLTSDPQVKPALERSIAAVAEQSARAWIDLASAKRTRVRGVHAELQNLGVDARNSSEVLAAADRALAAAQTAFERGAYNEARQHSGEAMKFVRFLQHRHWWFAVQKLSSPVSSPYTICFQTLPDHWRMIRRLGQSRAKMEANLLLSGDFEDEDTMIVEGWQHSQSSLDGVRAGAELVQSGREGKYCLRLWAAPVPGHQQLGSLPHSPVTMTTPPLPVRSGQIVHVSGWVQVVAPVTQSLDGAMLYDSLLGPSGALRWDTPAEWQRFELIREVHESGDFSLNLVLTGLGDVRFDDLQVVPHDPQAEIEFAGHSSADGNAESNQRSGPLKLLDRLPKLGPLQRR